MHTKLASPRAAWGFCLGVPVLLGLVSVCLGADANFDLLNYHLYNPYAFLGGRTGTDLAPAGMQSYFNPLLDLGYYGMAMHWPPMLTGFTLGLLQGLNFPVLYGIGMRVLDGAEPERRRAALLLAAAGCLSVNFLSELGNTMGDNFTALFELGALYLVLSRWDALQAWSVRAAVLLVAAGLASGIGTGFKLTNAIYAVALSAAFLVLPLRWPARLRLGFLFGAGVVLGFAVTGGFWLLEMWRQYGNPLYPQFSAFFTNPLTRAIGIGDTRWGPDGLLETLGWPFLFALDPLRVGQLRLLQLLWPMLYLLMLGWGGQALYRRLRPGAQRSAILDPCQRYLLAYVAVGFVVWMKLFSICRYIVPIELVAPLAIFILYLHLFGPGRGGRFATWTLSLATAFTLLCGVRTWGHEPWAPRLFRADLPVLESPAATSVLLVGTRDTLRYTWLAPLFPPEVSFIGLQLGFPESRAYVARAHDMVQGRGGMAYVIVQSSVNPRAAGVENANAWADRLGLTEGMHGCATLHWLTDRLHLHARVQDDADGARCRLDVLEEDRQDLAAGDQHQIAVTSRVLAGKGFVLDAGSCTRYQAYVGAGTYPYLWCRVTEREKGAQDTAGGG